jgi:Spy/CpxP family protein refolding chaperone
MSDDAMPVAPRSGRGLRWALAVSLAVNLAVAGVVVGAWARHQGMGARGDMVRELRFGMFTDAMEPDQRAALRAAFVAQAPDLRQARRDMRQEMAGLLVALRAEPFDPARLAALLDAQDKRVADRMALGQSLLRDFVNRLDPAARLAFAARLEARMAGKGAARPEGDNP